MLEIFNLGLKSSRDKFNTIYQDDQLKYIYDLGLEKLRDDFMKSNNG